MCARDQKFGVLLPADRMKTVSRVAEHHSENCVEPPAGVLEQAMTASHSAVALEPALASIAARHGDGSSGTT